MCISTSSGDCGQLSLVCSGCRPRPSLPDGHPVLKSYRQLLGQRGKRSSLVSLTSELQSVSVNISTMKITSKVVEIRAKAKMQNIFSRKSLEKTKQIQPCCLTYYTTNQLGTSTKIWSTLKIFRNHLKIARNTKNQREK